MNNLSPVLLFTYKRIDTLKRTVEALINNFLAKESKLFIFSDGYANNEDKVKVEKVREYLKTINGFNSITIFESNENKGLANSIITGVTKIIKEYEKVIVLEDDLVTSCNFLSFMNQALDFYENNYAIISISGYNMKVKNIKGEKYIYDIFFTKRSASWGWATWRNRWDLVDWTVKDFSDFSKNRIRQKEFNLMGSDMYKMLKEQQDGLNNSWAIRFCYHQFVYNLYTVYPLISKVKNIGFTEEATHTKQKYNRFDVAIDYTNNIDFIFSDKIFLNEKLLKAFKALNSIKSRLISKLINLFRL